MHAGTPTLYFLFQQSGWPLFCCPSCCLSSSFFYVSERGPRLRQVCYFLPVSSLCLAIVLLSPSGNVSLCNGEVHNFTCEVTGASLLWIFDSDADAVYSSSVVNSQSLGPHIDTWFVSAVGGVVISNATVTGSPALNRTTLQCRNSSGFSSITFNIGKINFDIFIDVA